MKGFIEITPRSYDSGNFMDIEGKWVVSNPEMININSIVKFGNNYIFISAHPEAYPILTVEDYEQLKELIKNA